MPLSTGQVRNVTVESKVDNVNGLHLRLKVEPDGGKTKEAALVDRHRTNLAKAPLDFLS